MQVAVEFYHDLPIVSIILFTAYLIQTFAMSIAILYGAHIYVQSLPGRFVPDCQSAKQCKASSYEF